MKNCIKKTGVILLGTGLLLGGVCGCSKSNTEPLDSDGLQILPRVSYDLIDGAGTDSWFGKAGNALPDSLRFHATYANGTSQKYPPELMRIRGRVYFRDITDGFSANARLADNTGYLQRRLIYLNRLDTDTLTVEVQTQATPNNGAIEQLRFYYNNRLSASYDFRANKALNDSLYHRSLTGLVVPLHKFSNR